MIFGLFNTKGQRLLKMTEESLREADIFVGIIKEKIGEEIILWMNRCENKDVNSLKDIGKEAMEERQSEITEMGEKNPNWVRACIVESYVSAKIFGKPKSVDRPRHGTGRHGTTRHDTTRHNTAPHRTAQHSTKQQNIA